MKNIKFILFPSYIFLCSLSCVRLSLMPEALVEHPPLAQCFSLYGISPHLPEKQIHTRFQVNRALERCVGRSGTFQPQMWPLFAMNILKMVSGHRGNCNEVKVRVQMWPGDQVVVYCHTSEGEVGFIFQEYFDLKFFCFSSISISIWLTSTLLSAKPREPRPLPICPVQTRCRLSEWSCLLFVSVAL